MIIREIQKEDNQQIASVIREVFISDNYPKTGTAFADVQLDYLYETYNNPRSIYYIIEIEGKIFGGGGGTILPEEIRQLHQYGISRIYSPDDGRQMGLEGMIEDVIKQCDFELPTSFNYPHVLKLDEQKDN